MLPCLYARQANPRQPTSLHPTQRGIYPSGNPMIKSHTTKTATKHTKPQNTQSHTTPKATKRQKPHNTNSHNPPKATQHQKPHNTKRHKTPTATKHQKPQKHCHSPRARRGRQRGSTGGEPGPATASHRLRRRRRRRRLNIPPTALPMPLPADSIPLPISLTMELTGHRPFPGIAPQHALKPKAPPATC